MSPNSDSFDIGQYISDVRTNHYVGISAITLIVYDTILNFPAEIEFIWKGKFRLAATLYVMARYPTILSLILALVARYPIVLFKNDVHESATSICSDLLHVMDVSYFFSFIGIQGLLVARAYAISGRNRVVHGIFLFADGTCWSVPAHLGSVNQMLMNV